MLSRHNTLCDAVRSQGSRIPVDICFDTESGKATATMTQVCSGNAVSTLPDIAI